MVHYGVEYSQYLFHFFRTVSFLPVITLLFFVFDLCCNLLDHTTRPPLESPHQIINSVLLCQ